jgi:hypothetical protein
MDGAASTLQPCSNQASRSYHKDGAKDRGRIVAEGTAPDDDPEKQIVAHQRADYSVNNVMELDISGIRAVAGAFSVSGYSGQPTGNRTQQDTREKIHRRRLC